MKEHLWKIFGREPTDSELAEATKMSTVQLRKSLEVGRAARNKLIKVSTIVYSNVIYQLQVILNFRWP